MLLRFLADLTRDEKLKRDFGRDPEGTLQRAGLNAEQIETLRGRDPRRIAALLARELSDGGLVGWPAPKVTITPPVQPASGRAGETLPTFTINGRCFAQDATADIESGGVVVSVRDVKVTSQGNDTTTLTGRLVLPADLTPGSYTVRVANGAQPEDQDTVPGAFQVTASGT